MRKSTSGALRKMRSRAAISLAINRTALNSSPSGAGPAGLETVLFWPVRTIESARWQTGEHKYISKLVL